MSADSLSRVLVGPVVGGCGWRAVVIHDTVHIDPTLATTSQVDIWGVITRECGEIKMRFTHKPVNVKNDGNNSPGFALGHNTRMSLAALLADHARDHRSPESITLTGNVGKELGLLLA